jgi:hypothetical protein
MTDSSDNDSAEESKIVNLRSGRPESRTYECTMISNSRRYSQSACPHKGPFTVDRKLATVECGDCGALLNPMYVLEKLALKETYWNQRQKDLSAYLKEINQEIDDRTRTRCTHCGNMTAIRFKREVPRTWVPQAYD